MALAAAAALVVVAIAGCNGGSSQTPSSGPASTGSVALSSPTEGLTQLTASAGDTASASDSGLVTGSPGATASGSAAPATPDAVASELDAIQQLIDDINNSLSSSDQSEQGGE